MRVAGLILAAGAGTRMGRPKAEVVLGGRRMVDRQVDLLIEAGCDPVVVVLGAALVTVPRATVVVNSQWATGMGSSLVAGLAHLSNPPSGADQEAPPDAVAVVLVDQPGLTAATVTATLAAVSQGARAARASYNGRPGHPVVLSRSTWHEIATAAALDTGARGWLAAHAGEVVLVVCDGLGEDGDVDTPEELLAREDSGSAT